MKLKSFSAMVAIAAASIVASNAYAGPSHSFVEQSVVPGQVNVVTVGDNGVVSEKRMSAAQAAKIAKAGPSQNVEAGQQVLRQADSNVPSTAKGSELGMAASKLGSMLPMNPFMKAGLGAIEKAKAGYDERKANGEEAKPIDNAIDVGGQAVNGAKKIGTSALGFAGGLLDKLKSKRAEADAGPAQNSQPNNGM